MLLERLYSMRLDFRNFWEKGPGLNPKVLEDLKISSPGPTLKSSSPNPLKQTLDLLKQEPKP